MPVENNEEPAIQWIGAFGQIIDKYNESSKSKKAAKGEKVYLYEDDKVQVPIDQCVYVKNKGYFLKDDPRIQQDYLTHDSILVIEGKSKYNEYYGKINENGQLVEPRYSNYRPEDFAPSNIGSDLVEIILDIKQPNYKYFHMDLLNNSLFNEIYEESILSGKFYQKGTAAHKNIVGEKLHMKIHGRKHKNALSFLKMCNIKNIPFTYFGTFGKKYTFGVEIETMSGVLPKYLDSKIYYSGVHDGSLKHEDDKACYGIEYVTDVLKGDNGLKQLKMLSNELSKRCLINKQCGRMNATL